SAQATALATGAALATGVGAAVTGSVGAALGTAAGGIASLFGFKSEELEQVGAELGSDCSAVILLVKAAEVEPVTEFLQRLGATGGSPGTRRRRRRTGSEEGPPPGEAPPPPPSPSRGRGGADGTRPGQWGGGANVPSSPERGLR